MRICQVCNGSGKVNVGADGPNRPCYVDCEACDGTGRERERLQRPAPNVAVIGPPTGLAPKERLDEVVSGLRLWLETFELQEQGASLLSYAQVYAMTKRLLSTSAKPPEKHKVTSPTGPVVPDLTRRPAMASEQAAEKFRQVMAEVTDRVWSSWREAIENLAMLEGTSSLSGDRTLVTRDRPDGMDAWLTPNDSPPDERYPMVQLRMKGGCFSVMIVDRPVAGDSGSEEP